MRHLLGIQHLTKDELLLYIENSLNFVEVGTRELKKVPTLRGKTIINLFLEASTRTRASFEIAGKWLSADVINIGSSDSSTTKGETFLDTAKTLQAMCPDVIVVRHKHSGAAKFLADFLKATSIVNAGDGSNEHPTQALLDLITLAQALKLRPNELSGLKVAIVGDVLHSRVARSNVWAHQLLGNEVTLVGPPSLVPPDFVGKDCFGAKEFGGRVNVTSSLVEGIKGADVVMVLRMQLERQNDFFVPSLQEYTDEFCVTESLLAKHAPRSVVLHPGPVNRGIEISTEVADGPRSLIEKQVNSGVAVRMAVLFTVVAGSKNRELSGEVEMQTRKVAQ